MDAEDVVEEACRVVGAAIGGIAEWGGLDVIVIMVASSSRCAPRSRYLEDAAEQRIGAETPVDARHQSSRPQEGDRRGGAALVLYEQESLGGFSGEDSEPDAVVTDSATTDREVGPVAEVASSATSGRSGRLDTRRAASPGQFREVLSEPLRSSGWRAT